MPMEHNSGHGGISSGVNLLDVLDRVLDKGIVIDAWIRVSLVGIDLVSVEARVVVASIDTYLRYAEAVGLTPPASRSIGVPRQAITGNGEEVAVSAERVTRRVAAPRRRPRGR
jgi:hypothetical protein